MNFFIGLFFYINELMLRIMNCPGHELNLRFMNWLCHELNCGAIHYRSRCVMSSTVSRLTAR